MRIPDSVLDEVLAAVDIVEVISETVELKKAGNGHKGLCPFHPEKTPSFSVSQEKGLFHCFGCKASGNAIGFIMRLHNFDFPEAVTFLAERYGIDIPVEDGPKKETKDLYAVHTDVLTIAKRNYLGKDGRQAREYMSGRKLPDEIVDRYEIGYLPARMDTKDLARKFGTQRLIDSGVFVEGKYGPRIRFYDRLIIPIRDIMGRTVGFSGRILSGDGPKYINSPETDIFHKRKVLFNLDRAKDAIREKGYCIVVEGYFDVMRLAANGIENAVSPMGTALTKEHAGILKRYTDETVIVFDGDDAGMKAAVKSLDAFIPANFFPTVIFLPKGDDPDSMVLNRGAGAFERLLASRIDLFEHVTKRAAKKAKDFNRRMKAMNALREKLLTINDPYRREHYGKMVAETFAVDPDMLKKDIDLSRAKSVVKKAANPAGVQAVYRVERDFIASLFSLAEDVADGLVSEITEDHFNDPAMRNIFKKVVEIFRRGSNISVLVNDPDVTEHLPEVYMHEVLAEDMYRFAMQNRDKVISNHIRKQFTKINEEIARAGDNPERLGDLFAQKVKLRNRIMELEGKTTGSN